MGQSKETDLFPNWNSLISWIRAWWSGSLIPKTDPGYFDLVTTHSIVHSIRLEYFFNQIFKLEISLVFPKLKLSNQLDQGLMSRQLDSGLNFRVTWSHWFRNCKFQISKRSQIIFRFWNSKFQDSWESYRSHQDLDWPVIDQIQWI